MATASLPLCLRVLHYLRAFDAPLSTIAGDLQVSETQVRRAIKTLQAVVEIDFERQEGVPIWALRAEIDRAQAVALATSIFVDKLDGRALLERVGLEE